MFEERCDVHQRGPVNVPSIAMAVHSSVADCMRPANTSTTTDPTAPMSEIHTSHTAEFPVVPRYAVRGPARSRVTVKAP